MEEAQPEAERVAEGAPEGVFWAVAERETERQGEGEVEPVAPTGREAVVLRL